MSRHAAIETEWGDGEYTFRLGLDQLQELEERRNTSIFTLAARLSPELRDARLADISEVLRAGLIGGGMRPIEAKALVRRYCDERPLDESRDVAYAVAMAAIARVHGGTLEEPASGEAGAAEPNGSTSPPSTEPPA